MTEYHDWYHGLQVGRTLAALKKNHFDARFVPGAKETLDEIFGIIPEHATVGQRSPLERT